MGKEKNDKQLKVVVLDRRFNLISDHHNAHINDNKMILLFLPFLPI